MYFKFLIFLAVFILIGCSNDDSGTTVMEDFQDDDGDGVSNTQEINAGTDPNDACSFNLSQLEFDKTTEVWRNRDCDGDGVPNGAELDPDGNNQNDNNGTDPLDNCSLDITLQSLQPSNEWLTLDCDEDCVNNDKEMDAGTDPTDPTDFPGAGTQLLMITRYETDGTIEERAFFEENGTRIKELVYSDNLIQLAAYSYDTNNRLISFSTSTGTVNFDYQNGLIFTITRSGTYGYTKTVTYDSNEIITDDGNAPTGYFSNKIILDPTTGKAISVESFNPKPSNPDEFFYDLREYTYDANGFDVTRIETTNLEYYESTGEFHPSPGGDVLEIMEYNNLVSNPIQNAFADLYIHRLLEGEIIRGALFQGKCAECPTLMDKYSVFLSLGSDERYLEIDCVQENGLPFMADQTTFYEPEPQLMEYLYE